MTPLMLIPSDVMPISGSSCNTAQQGGKRNPSAKGQCASSQLKSDPAPPSNAKQIAVLSLCIWSECSARSQCGVRRCCNVNCSVVWVDSLLVLLHTVPTTRSKFFPPSKFIEPPISQLRVVLNLMYSTNDR